MLKINVFITFSTTDLFLFNLFVYLLNKINKNKNLCTVKVFITIKKSCNEKATYTLYKKRKN